jgi:hypothetical protein
MLDAIEWWLSLRRNANFWDWVRDTYSLTELEELAKEATDCHLRATFNPLGDLTWDQYLTKEGIRRRTVKRLYNRYGDEIWGACLAGLDEHRERNALACLAGLDCADEVHTPELFEEFLVRNALKTAARQILEERK